MYLILMVYACLISCSLTNKSKCHSLAYFNLRWTCVVILHKYVYIINTLFIHNENSCDLVYILSLQNISKGGGTNHTRP